MKTPGTPKPWMNTALRTMMGLPGLRRVLGKSLALITVTGAKSGRLYSTPVQYITVGNDYVVLTQHHRIWWRNIRRRPSVQLSIAGERVDGRGTIPEGADALEVLSACLEAKPGIAKFYRIERTGVDRFDPADVERLAEAVVPIVITPV